MAKAKQKTLVVNTNAVLLAVAGAFIGQQIFASKRDIEPGQDGNDTNKKKVVLEFKSADGTLVNGTEVEELQITDTASAARFMELFANLPVIKGGFYSYTNSSGVTNPQILTTFDAQGLGKLMAQTISAANTLISQGGEQADEMRAVMTAVFGYNEIAAAQISERKAMALADEIGKLQLTPEKRAALLASLGGTANVPQPTVNANEAEGSDAPDADGKKGKGGSRKRDHAHV